MNVPNHRIEKPAERRRKRKIPLFILVLVGIFLATILFYMLSAKPKPEDAPQNQQPLVSSPAEQSQNP